MSSPEPVVELTATLLLSGDQPVRTLVIAAMVVIASPAWGADPITIEMHGDSTTAGTTGKPGHYHAATFYEGYDLGVWIPDVTIVTKGEGGMTCADRQNGTRSYKKNIWEEMAASKATIVTFNYGYNDPGYVSADIFEACMGMLIRVAQHYGKTVAVETPLGTDPTIARYADAAATAAADNGAYLIDHMALMDHQFPEWRDHLPDGTHPDDALYIQKALIAYTVLNPLVRDRR